MGYFASGKGILSDTALAALICREMKWTWEEYQSQPSWFVDNIFEMLKAEASATAREIAKAKSRN